MPDDSELLRSYAESGSESAIRELLRRHLRVVYFAALRRTAGNTALAEEIAQQVFVTLARQAKTLVRHRTLAGWLYTTTRNTAANAVRAESTRRRYEHDAAMYELTSAEPAAEWERVRPLIDDALDMLDERDREAILIRFFEGQSFAEVGSALRISQDAARMRVDRAVDKLRSVLERRGIRSASAALAGVLATQGAIAVPTGVMATVSSAVMAAGVASATITGSASILAMTTIQKVIAGTAIVAAVGVGVREYQTVQQQREQIAAKEGELASLRTQVGELIRERDEAKSQWSTLQSEIDSAIAAVSRRKGSVAKDDSSDVKALLDRAATLRQRVAQLPSAWARASNLLTKDEWMSVAVANPLDTQASIDNALAQIQHKVVGKWAETVQAAALSFAKNSGGLLPTDASQLAAYLPPDADTTMLQRFELLRMGNINDLSRDRWLIANIGALDDDSNFVAMFGRGNTTVGSDDSGDKRETLRAYLGFVRAHNGQPATELSQLQPYFRRSIDPQRSEEFWRQVAPFLR